LFAAFLQRIDAIQYADYVIETYGERPQRSNASIKLTYSRTLQEPSVSPVKSKPVLLDELMPRLSALSEDNEAVQFCIKRRIPRQQFDRLYFIDNISNIAQLNEKYRNKLTNTEPRLVLPFFDHRMQLSGVTCRALRDEELRYLTIKIKENSPLIFGLERVDIRKLITIVEGPIDSLFINNAIAVAGTSFGKIHEIKLPDVRVVFDNQPRNREVCKLMHAVIDTGVKVVVWPSNIEHKDINDMVLAGLDVESLLNEHTHSGLEAKLRFTGWKRC
jgi:hypothetical protein